MIPVSFSVESYDSFIHAKSATSYIALPPDNETQKSSHVRCEVIKVSAIRFGGLIWVIKKKTDNTKLFQIIHLKISVDEKNCIYLQHRFHAVVDTSDEGAIAPLQPPPPQKNPRPKYIEIRMYF